MIGMDLSNYKSLRVCSKVEVLQQMSKAKKKIEIYAPTIDAHLFSNLSIPPHLNIKLVLSKQVFDTSDDEFLKLFERVFYESFQMTVDIKEGQRVKLLKVGCVFFIGCFTFLFLALSSLAMKGLIFFMLLGLGGYFCTLSQRKTKWQVSKIKRFTDFNVMDNHLLAFLPVAYLIDDQFYMGMNVLSPLSNGEIYEIESEEEKQQLIFMYSCYANRNAQLSDEWMINYYLERMDVEQFSQIRYQD